MNASSSQLCAVVVWVVAGLLLACEGRPDASDQPEAPELTQTERHVVEGALSALVAGLEFDTGTPGSDAALAEDFRRQRDVYEAVVALVRANPELTRFSRSPAPARYHTFTGESGLVAELGPDIYRLLSSESLPNIIDGDLRPEAERPVLRFVKYQAGTVVRGVSKGIALVPNPPPTRIVDSLDDWRGVATMLERDADRCAFRPIEGDWYIWLCR